MAGGEFWRTGEIELLRRMAGRRRLGHMARSLGRSLPATRTMINRLGLSYRFGLSEEEKDHMLADMAGVYPTRVIAVRMNCSTRAVQWRATKLGISLRLIKLNTPGPYEPGVLTYEPSIHKRNGATA